MLGTHFMNTHALEIVTNHRMALYLNSNVDNTQTSTGYIVLR